MSWIGAGLGAIFGSRGGLLSSIVGAVVGNWLEEKAKEFISGDTKSKTRKADVNDNTRELTVLAAIAAMLAKMAKADGRITEDEVRCCEKVFDRLGLKGEKREYCIRVFRAAKDDAHTIYDYADSLVMEGVDTDVREIIYDLLWDLAFADGSVSRYELEMLRQLPPHLRLSLYAFVRQCSRRGLGGDSGGGANGPISSDPYELLGVSRSASDEEVKKAYREKAKALHPDRLRAEGLSEELLGRANERMARINAAWSEIRRQRGI